MTLKTDNWLWFTSSGRNLSGQV